MSDIRLPALSPSMTDGTVAHWHKRAGDTVEAGEPLVDIETAKTVLEMESPVSGVLDSLLASVGEEVAVGAVIARLVGADGVAVKLEAVEGAVSKATPQAFAGNVPGGNTGLATLGLRISPRARKLAREEGLAPAALTGTGPQGRILERDVKRVLAEGAKMVAATSVIDVPGSTLTPHTPTRRYIATRLQDSKQHIPHFYLNMDCEVDALVEFRSDFNGEAGRKPEEQLSLNDFVIRALALALRDVPALNASWEEAGVRRFDKVDLAVAVATPDGLLTPVLRNAEAKGLGTISREMRELATRAREGKPRPEEYSGGGFTLSNLGMYGVRSFSPIINPPQIGILAAGAVERRPVVRGDVLEIASVISVTLSVDHRSVDGAEAARFLATFRRYLEEPCTMLL